MTAHGRMQKRMQELEAEAEQLLSNNQGTESATKIRALEARVRDLETENGLLKADITRVEESAKSKGELAQL